MRIRGLNRLLNDVGRDMVSPFECGDLFHCPPPGGGLS